MSFKLPEDLDAALTEAASRKGLSRSELVRRALANLTKARARTALDLAGPLVGSLEGPPDLSTNASYLDDLGE